MSRTVTSGQTKRGSHAAPVAHVISTALFLLVALAFVVFLGTRLELDIADLWRSISGSDPVLYSVALALYYAGFLIRGWRWRLILKYAGTTDDPGREPPSILECTQIVVLGRFTDSVTWLRLGNLYRAYLVSGLSLPRFSRTAGTVVAELFLDVLVVLAVALLLAAVVAFQGTALPVGGIVAAAVVIGAAATIGLVLMRRFGPALSHRLPRTLGAAYLEVHQGTLGSLSFGRMPALLALGAVIWVFAVGRWLFVAASLGEVLSPAMLLFVSLVNALLAAVPVTPGGLGVVEPGVAGALMMGIDAESAIAITILERSISYLSVIAVGAVLLFAREGYRARNIARRDVESGESRRDTPSSV